MEFAEEQDWSEVKEKLLNLLSAASLGMAPENRRWFDEFLAHGEYELAYEGILQELTRDPNTSAPLSTAQIDSVISLGSSLGYDSESDMVYRAFMQMYVPKSWGRQKRK